MSFFDDDPFEDFVNEIFGKARRPANGKRTIIQGEGDDRTIDFIEGEKDVFVIFELPGFSEKDILVSVKGGELTIEARKQRPDNLQPYLVQKLSQGVFIKKTLPKFVNAKKFEHTMRNGILELTFKKSGGKK